MLSCLQAPLVMNVKVLIGGAVIFLSVCSGFLNLVYLIVLISGFPRVKFDNRHDFPWNVAISAQNKIFDSCLITESFYEAFDFSPGFFDISGFLDYLNKFQCSPSTYSVRAPSRGLCVLLNETRNEKAKRPNCEGRGSC